MYNTLEKKRAYARTWYHKNKEHVKAYRAAHPEFRLQNKKYMRERYAINETHRQKNRLFFLEKLGGKCRHCGIADPRVLQFDHIDPLTKVCNLGNLFAAKDQSKVWEEVQKCQLLCANCHTIKTLENGDKHAKRRAA